MSEEQEHPGKVALAEIIEWSRRTESDLGAECIANQWAWPDDSITMNFQDTGTMRAELPFAAMMLAARTQIDTIRSIAAYVSELEARADAAEAENARLREALQAVVDEYPFAAGNMPMIDPEGRNGYGSIRAARSALSSQSSTGQNDGQPALSGTDGDRDEVGTCEQCSKPIFPGDQYYHSGDGVDLCLDHAPMLSDVVAYLEGIVASGKGDEDRSPEEAAEDLANVRARIAEGGDRKAVHTA